MAVTRGVTTVIDNFNRATLMIEDIPEAGTGWTITDTAAAGTMTYQTITNEVGGAMELQLVSDSEVENLCMDQNDILTLSPVTLQHIWFVVKVTTFGSASVLTCGVGSARADDEDAVVENAYIKMEGATSTTAIEVETNDGVTDTLSVTGNGTLAGVYKKLLIDFSDVSLGAGSVKFFVDGARVSASTDFTFAGWTAVAGNYLQPTVQLSKASSANTSAVTIAQIGYQYSWAFGA